MKVFECFLVLWLALGDFAAAQGPYTYWLHSSCIAPDSPVLPSFADALRWERSAANRLINRDPLQHEYFKRLFSPAGQPGEPQYEDLVTKVAGMLGHSSVKPGISNMVREPTNDRNKANFRFYCDNDRLDGGSQRWTLRPDPPVEQRPDGYTPQSKRPFILAASPGEACQEYFDPNNRMVMDKGDRGGCQTPQTCASTYRVKLPGPWTPGVRATVTICDYVLKQHEFKPVLHEAVNTQDVTKFSPVMIGDRMFYPIEFVESLISEVILHEMHHLPAWWLEDEPSPLRDSAPVFEGLAYGWRDVQALSPDKQINNVNNFVYFAALARLAELGYRLARREDRAKLGYLERL
ncbi:MAG: hypothetical protein Q9227_007031 [Pyrenula ochraceoflavens]